MKTALVIGATGLVGKTLTHLLLSDERFSSIKVFVRRTTGIRHRKLEEHLVSFDTMPQWQQNLTGDVLFSCLGTTLKKAGTKEAQYKIDFTYQYDVAYAAAQNNVPQYVLVSSSGASSKSRIFYSRMKGELEDAVKTFPFSQIHILQPGILQGNREEFRLGERIGVEVLSAIQFIPGMKKYAPIPAKTVARAMINASFLQNNKVTVWGLEKVFALANMQ